MSKSQKLGLGVFVLVFYGAGDCTQGLGHGRQILYHSATSPPQKLSK